MNRNAAARLSIASSVALVLLFLGGAAQIARQRSADAPPPQMVSGEAIAAAPNQDGQQDGQYDEQNADDDAAKVRRATTDWVKESRPNVRIDGVFMIAFAKGNLYLAGADCIDNDKHETVDVLVRRYTRRNGGQYYRAEGVSNEQAERLRQKATFDEAATEAADESAATGWDDGDDDDECRR